MTIRPSQPADLDGIIVLLSQLWPDKELDCDTLAGQLDSGLASSSREFLCAEDGGGVTGFCAMEYHESLWRGGMVAYVEVLVVDGARRSQGIGAALMDEVTHLARARGCKAIELDTAFHRERAHAFYEKLGFARRGYVFAKDL